MEQEIHLVRQHTEHCALFNYGPSHKVSVHFINYFTMDENSYMVLYLFTFIIYASCIYDSVKTLYIFYFTLESGTEMKELQLLI